MNYTFIISIIHFNIFIYALFVFVVLLVALAGWMPQLVGHLF